MRQKKKFVIAQKLSYWRKVEAFFSTKVKPFYLTKIEAFYWTIVIFFHWTKLKAFFYYTSKCSLLDKGKLSTLAPRLVSFHRHSRPIPIVPAFSNDAGMTGWGKNDRDGNWNDLLGGSPHPVILGPVQSFQGHPCHSDGMRTKVIPNHSIWE